MLFCQLCRQQENICSPEKEAESDTVEWTLPGSRGQYCSRPWDCQRGNTSSTFHELKSIKVHVTTRFLHAAGKARALEGRQLRPEDLRRELNLGCLWSRYYSHCSQRTGTAGRLASQEKLCLDERSLPFLDSWAPVATAYVLVPCMGYILFLHFPRVFTT